MYCINKILNSDGREYQINSNIIDGGWVIKSYTIYSNTAIAKGAEQTASLNEYLPNDGYCYEVLFYAAAQTGATNGNTIRFKVGNDLSPTNDVYVVGGSTTGANVVALFWGQHVVQVGPSRILKVWNSGNANGNIWLQPRAYKRIGTNNWDNINQLDNFIGTDNNIFAIHHENQPGNWVTAGWTIYNGNDITMNKGNTLSFDISSYIPVDGYNYEALLSSWWNNNSGVANQNSEVYVRIGNYYNMVNGARTYNDKGTKCSHHQSIIPILDNARKFDIYMSQGTTCSSKGFTFTGYRRLNKVGT